MVLWLILGCCSVSTSKSVPTQPEGLGLFLLVLYGKYFGRSASVNHSIGMKATINKA